MTWHLLSYILKEFVVVVWHSDANQSSSDGKQKNYEFQIHYTQWRDTFEMFCVTFYCRTMYRRCPIETVGVVLRLEFITAVQSSTLLFLLLLHSSSQSVPR